MKYLVRFDWPAALGVGAYFGSWGFATLYLGTDEYWFALRLYPLGLLLTVSMLALFCLAMVWFEHKPTITAKLIWLVYLVLELNEIWIYATCRVLHNPLLDAEGNRIGEMKMAEIWGVTVKKTACGRLLDIPGDLLSWVGLAVLLGIAIAPMLRKGD